MKRLIDKIQGCGFWRSLMSSLLLVSLIIQATPANASTIMQVSLGEMLNKSEFIFQGQVFSSESFPESGRIYTAITFDIVEIIKGSYPRRQITLTFLGGTVGDLSLRVSDLRMPVVGEKGIYFVESLQRRQVNPLYGWEQGHFLITRNSIGSELVTNSEGNPVTQIEAGASAPPAINQRTPFGVHVAPLGARQGLTPRSFIQQLRQIMGEIR
jgi:hypothetical protein